jgi:Glycine/sarcosine/betaine reductase component B subunits
LVKSLAVRPFSWLGHSIAAWRAFVRTLYRRHRRDLNFIGVILCRSHHNDHQSKERNGYMVANVVRLLGAQGALMTLEGTANTWIDFMQSVKTLERSGIRTVQIVHELGGVEGEDWPIADYTEVKVSSPLVGEGQDGRKQGCGFTPSPQAFWGRFLRDRTGAASLVALAPAGGEGLGEGEEAPTACTLTPALSLAGRGRSACMASREKPTLVSQGGGDGDT